MKKLTGMSNKQIGHLFGELSYSAVAKVYQRFSAEAKTNKPLRKSLKELSQFVLCQGLTPVPFLVGPKESDDPKVVEAANAERRKDSMLKFGPGDVRYLLVEKTSDIPNLVDFINTRLGHFSHNELKVLSTKIISLDEISKDI